MQLSNIPACPVSYDGNNFKSKLEARYYALFKELGINVVYEPTRFLMKYNMSYTPDFALYGVRWRGESAEYYTNKTGQPIFVEVKGASSYRDINTNAQVRIETFSAKKPILVVGNIPEFLSDLSDHRGDKMFNFYFMDGGRETCFFCRKVNEIWLEGINENDFRFSSIEKELSIARQAFQNER